MDNKWGWLLIALAVGVVGWIFLKSRDASAATGESPADSYGGGGGYPASGGVVSGGMTTTATGSEGGMARDAAKSPVPTADGNPAKPDDVVAPVRKPGDNTPVWGDKTSTPDTRKSGRCPDGQFYNTISRKCQSPDTSERWGGTAPTDGLRVTNPSSADNPRNRTSSGRTRGQVDRTTGTIPTGKATPTSTWGGAPPAATGSGVAPSLGGKTFSTTKKSWGTETVQDSENYGKVNSANKWGGH